MAMKSGNMTSSKPAGGKMGRDNMTDHNIPAARDENTGAQDSHLSGKPGRPGDSGNPTKFPVTAGQDGAGDNKGTVPTGYMQSSKTYVDPKKFSKSK